MELQERSSAINSGANINDPTLAIHTVPANQFWKVTSLDLVVDTDATVGTRTHQVRVKDASGAVMQMIQIPLTQAASLTRRFSLYAGASAAAAYINTSYATHPLPSNLILPPGATVSWYDTAQISYVAVSGTATASTITTMTDDTAAWTVNQWAGRIVQMGGSTATVLSNTATALTFAAWDPLAPVTGAYSFSLDAVSTFIMNYDLWERMY